MSTYDEEQAIAATRTRALAHIESLPPGPLRDALATLDAAVRDGHIGQGEVVRYFAVSNPPPDWALESAREEANDELEIDDDPMASESEDGCWVNAWVWVPRPPMKCATCGNEEDEPGEMNDFDERDRLICAACAAERDEKRSPAGEE